MPLYRPLYDWYETNKRSLPWRETHDPYAIWLSEIILQQTRVQQGLDYYRRFLNRWPRVEDLASADEADVLREWQGLGYYTRARNLHKAAKIIMAKGEGRKANGEEIFPQTYEELRALPGVGDYTAGAIASFAYDLPYPAVDGNVYRVIARLLDIDEAFDTTAGKKLFHKQIEALLDRDHPRLFNSAIMEFGALYCTPVLGDNCLSCPLKDYCAGYAHGTAALLPVRKPRPKVRDRWFTYHIYLSTEDRGQNTDLFTLIRRREDKDIWYHLYEFPCEESNSPQDGLTGGIIVPHAGKEAGHTSNSVAVSLTHILSHQKIHARFMIHKVQKMPEIPGTIVVRWEDLNDYALPRLLLKALSSLSLPAIPD